MLSQLSWKALAPSFEDFASGYCLGESFHAGPPLPQAHQLLLLSLPMTLSWRSNNNAERDLGRKNGLRRRLLLSVCETHATPLKIKCGLTYIDLCGIEQRPIEGRGNPKLLVRGGFVGLLTLSMWCCPHQLSERWVKWRSQQLCVVGIGTFCSTRTCTCGWWVFNTIRLRWTAEQAS